MSIVDIFCFEPVKAVKLKVSCEFIVFILGRGVCCYSGDGCADVLFSDKICRYYVMAYVPLGMWSRLITRLIVFSQSQVTEVISVTRITVSYKNSALTCNAFIY